MKKCKICNSKTEIIFSIMLKPVYICENCASIIFIQQAMWYKQKEDDKLIKNKFEEFIKNQKDIPEEYLNIINENFWSLI